MKCENIDKYEITYNRLKFGKEIGKGAFGHVFAAKINGTGDISCNNTVAVKKLKRKYEIIVKYIYFYNYEQQNKN